MIFYISQPEDQPEFARESETLINALWDLADLQDCDLQGAVSLTVADDEDESIFKLLYLSNQKGNDHTIIYFVDSETQETLYTVNDLGILYDLFELGDMDRLFDKYDFKRLRKLEDPKYKNVLTFEFEKNFKYYETDIWIKEGF